MWRECAMNTQLNPQTAHGWAMQTLIIVILSLPGITWISTTGDIATYWRDDVPPGQVIYILSKLTALYAFTVFWMQLMYGLLGADWRRRMGIERGHAFHVRLGAVVIALIVVHIGLFVLGASIRTHMFASQYLTPSFSAGYYRAVITLGIVAAALVGAAVVFAIVRRLMPRAWRFGHWAVTLAFVLAFVHSLLIGSESRIEPMTSFYVAAGTVALAVLLGRLWSSRPHASVDLRGPA